MAGPIVGWMVGAPESAVVIGGINALGVGVYHLGVAQKRIVNYEIALRAGRCVLMAHCTADEFKQGQDVIGRSDTEAPPEHPFLLPDVES